jgi:hypothetical protein
LEIEPEKFEDVKATLFQRFRGVTWISRDFPLKGLWQGRDREYQDEIMIFTVLDFSEGGYREFMSQYKEDLKESFNQEEVLITSQIIEVL